MLQIPRSSPLQTIITLCFTPILAVMSDNTNVPKSLNLVLTKTELEEAESVVSTLYTRALTPIDVTPVKLYGTWFLSPEHSFEQREGGKFMNSIHEFRDKLVNNLNRTLEASLTSKRPSYFARLAYSESDISDKRNHASAGWDKGELLWALTDRLAWYDANTTSNTIHEIAQVSSFTHVDELSPASADLSKSFTQWAEHLSTFIRLYEERPSGTAELQELPIMTTSANALQSLMAGEEKIKGKASLLRTERAFIRAAMALNAILSVSVLFLFNRLIQTRSDRRRL